MNEETGSFAADSVSSSQAVFPGGNHLPPPHVATGGTTDGQNNLAESSELSMKELCAQELSTKVPSMKDLSEPVEFQFPKPALLSALPSHVHAMNLARERERRNRLNEGFETLKGLIPNPTKSDRVLIVNAAINYIKELQGSVRELELRVETKKHEKYRIMGQKTGEGNPGDPENKPEIDEDQSFDIKKSRRSRSARLQSILGATIDYIKELLRGVSRLKFPVEKKRSAKCKNNNPENKPLIDEDRSFKNNNHNNSRRSSWLQIKSKVTKVAVRIIDDEVTIKVVQKKKINWLLFISKVLDELHLDLQHVAGGLQIGENYSFSVRAKVYEGSSVYSSAIANKLIEVMERENTSALPTHSYY